MCIYIIIYIYCFSIYCILQVFACICTYSRDYVYIYICVCVLHSRFQENMARASHKSTHIYIYIHMIYNCKYEYIYIYSVPACPLGGLYEPKRKVLWKNGKEGIQSELKRFGGRKKIANALSDLFGNDREFAEPLSRKVRK